MHELNRNWTLFFHAKDKSRDYEKNTIKLIDISTIETFWGTINHTPTPLQLFSTGKNYDKILKIRGESYKPNAFSFFEKGVSPQWDDPQNIKGAELSIRKFKGLEEISDMWLESIINLVSENFDNSENIKGIRVVDSTLPNRPMYRIEYWFNDVSKSEEIEKYIKQLFNVNSNLLYRVHSEVKES
jgi:hypothetical protein